MDAFTGLPTWHRWRELPDLAHLVVAPRPGWVPPASGEMADLLAERRVHDATGLRASPAGRILVRPVTQLEISSTELRELLAAGRDPRYLVPDAVRDLLHATRLYSVPRPTR
jgi:nicotinate-nucleotide adenylyltransferase